MDGLLVLDKPGGITSRDAVNQLLKALPKSTRVGHTGTLDPLATGVLVLCFGQATRLAEYVQAMDKEYLAAVTLGARSDTDDADGTVTPNPAAKPVAEEAIRAALPGFVGVLNQSPPAYSAVKIDGRRAHSLARQGRPVETQARAVTVYEIEPLAYEWPNLRLRIACGKGTYIRSIARDLGERLGVGGYVSQLRRSRVGPFRAEEGISLPCSVAEVSRRLRPAADALGLLPRIDLDEEIAKRFCHGQAVRVPSAVGNDPPVECVLFDAAGTLVGIGTRGPDGVVEPRKVLRSPSRDVEKPRPAG